MQNRSMNPETIAPPLGSYSHAVEVPEGSKVLFISGQVGIDADGNVVMEFNTPAMSRGYIDRDGKTKTAIFK